MFENPELMPPPKFQPPRQHGQYAAIYLTAEGPDSEKKTSYRFSTLGNVSDSSFITRLDFSWHVLTYLTFESFIAAHYGTSGGEFRFALDTPALTYLGTPVAAIKMPASAVDLGISLRMSF